jgi:hypothetical protein
LGYASGGINAVDELAWKGFGVALAGGEIVVVVIEAHVKTTIGRGNTRDVIENNI